ncbi:MAG: MOSC domain-containing protein, partial [Acidimicrobiales bacterium]
MTVAALYRYPVKSLQGQTQSRLDVAAGGVVGDRRWGMVDEQTGKLASAKRFARLFQAVGHEDRVVLPDGRSVGLDDVDAASAALSSWLERPVRLIAAGQSAAGAGARGALGASGGDGPLAYQMTFDPPNDEAELYDIPVPPGTLVDLAAVHVVSAATLRHCARMRPDLDWSVRRFRPNVVVDGELEPYEEDGWVGRAFTVGGLTLRVDQPTVRCAMPLRAQPALGTEPALAAQPALFEAPSALNAVSPNH